MPIMNIGSTPTTFEHVASKLVENNYSVSPVTPKSKRSNVKRWQQFSGRLPSAELIASWHKRFPRHSVGIVCGRTIAIDIDVTEPSLADEFEAATREIIPGDPLKRVGKPPKRLLLYRTVEPIRTSHMAGADFLGERSYFVAYGIHPDTRRPYEWVGASPVDRPLSALPVATADALASLRAAFASLISLRTTDEPAGILLAPVVGGLTDGRDTVLTKIVWSVWSSGIDAPEEIATQAWKLFAATVDLTRPKRNGVTPWAFSDALRKADYLVRSGKQRPAQSRAFAMLDNYDADSNRQFFNAVNAVAAHGLLAPAAVAVSDLMLSLASGPSGCFASPETIAAKLNLAEGTVKRARRKLAELGLWRRHVAGGGRGYSAHYFPNYSAAVELAVKVTELGTWNSSEWEENSPHSITLQENKITDRSFESLASWTNGDVL